MKLKTLALLAAAAILAVPAGAGIYTDVHGETVFTSNGLTLNAAGPVSSYEGTFNILDDGYSIGQNIVSASVTFWLRDQTRNESAYEAFHFDLDGDFFGAFAGELPFASTFLRLGTPFGGGLSLDLIATIESSGLLTYLVVATEGNFRLKQAELTVSTPDGATTISLLGLGLLGVAALRRKMA